METRKLLHDRKQTSRTSTEGGSVYFALVAGQHWYEHHFSKPVTPLHTSPTVPALSTAAVDTKFRVFGMLQQGIRLSFLYIKANTFNIMQSNQYNFNLIICPQKLKIAHTVRSWRVIDLSDFVPFCSNIVIFIWINVSVGFIHSPFTWTHLWSGNNKTIKWKPVGWQLCTLCRQTDCTRVQFGSLSLNNDLLKETKLI